MMIYQGKGGEDSSMCSGPRTCSQGPTLLYFAVHTQGWDSSTELGTTAEMIRSATKGLNTGHVSHHTSWYAEDLT